ARRAQVDERPSGRSLIAEVMDVGHHVVAQSPFVFASLVEVRVIEMGAQLRQRGVRNVEAQRLLAFHQCQPQPAPQTDAALLAPEHPHRGGSVASRKRGDPGQTAAFARATSLLQSARNCSSPRSVSGCMRSFFKTSGGSVATSAPIIAASTTWRGCRMEAARIWVAML